MASVGSRGRFPGIARSLPLTLRRPRSCFWSKNVGEAWARSRLQAASGRKALPRMVKTGDVEQMSSTAAALLPLRALERAAKTWMLCQFHGLRYETSMKRL
jgi:hypothetical protein